MHTVDLQNGCENKYLTIKYTKLDYKIDFFKEFKRKWLIVGVLVAVLAGVISPSAGAHGGILHTEYTAYIPLTYIYVTAGTKSSCSELKVALCDGRFHLAAQMFAHVLTPALVAALCWLLGDLTDAGMLRGALISSCGGTNTWLSLGFLCGGESHSCAVTSAVVDVLVSAVAVPISLFIICGCTSVPPLSHVLSSLWGLPPLALGMLVGGRLEKVCRVREARCAALLLVYVRCCDELRGGESAMDIRHVFGALGLASLWVLCGGALCVCVATVLCPHKRREAMLCANHKAFLDEWHRSVGCSARGAGRVVALVCAPAQAALLAAYV